MGCHGNDGKRHLLIAFGLCTPPPREGQLVSPAKKPRLKSSHFISDYFALIVSKARRLFVLCRGGERRLWSSWSAGRGEASRTIPMSGLSSCAMRGRGSGPKGGVATHVQKLFLHQMFWTHALVKGQSGTPGSPGPPGARGEPGTFKLLSVLDLPSLASLICFFHFFCDSFRTCGLSRTAGRTRYPVATNDMTLHLR